MASIRYDSQFCALLVNYGVATALNFDNQEQFNKLVAHIDQRPLAKNQWDSASLEAQFHKSITFLTKRDQGRVMGAFRALFSGDCTTSAAPDSAPVEKSVFQVMAEQVTEELRPAVEIMKQQPSTKE